MELRKCMYCQNDFEPGRKDKVYCSDGCRSKAYLARKADDNQIGDIIRDDRRQQQPHKNRKPIALTEGQFNSLINGSKSNGSLLKGLLDEKENKSDLKAELTEYRMKLYYTEKELDDTKRERDNLQNKLEQTTKELEGKEKSILDNVNATNLPAIIGACENMLTRIVSGGKLPISHSDLSSAEIGNIPSDIDAVVISIVDKIDKIKPEKPLKEKLARLKELLETNGEMIEGFL